MLCTNFPVSHILIKTLWRKTISREKKRGVLVSLLQRHIIHQPNRELGIPFLPWEENEIFVFALAFSGCLFLNTIEHIYSSVTKLGFMIQKDGINPNGKNMYVLVCMDLDYVYPVKD